MYHKNEIWEEYDISIPMIIDSIRLRIETLITRYFCLERKLEFIVSSIFGNRTVFLSSSQTTKRNRYQMEMHVLTQIERNNLRQ